MLSGKRDSNPRPSAWEADALPLSYSRLDYLFTVLLHLSAPCLGEANGAKVGKKHRKHKLFIAFFLRPADSSDPHEDFFLGGGEKLRNGIDMRNSALQPFTMQKHPVERREVTFGPYRIVEDSEYRRTAARHRGIERSGIQKTPSDFSQTGMRCKDMRFEIVFYPALPHTDRQPDQFRQRHSRLRRPHTGISFAGGDLLGGFHHDKHMSRQRQTDRSHHHSASRTKPNAAAQPISAGSSRCSPKRRSSAHNTAVASDDPPPSPALNGMRLRRRICTGATP